MTTVAFFGGSFDPPHVGHVLAAVWVLSTADIDELWVVPAFEHAFGKRLATFEHRQHMAELAFAQLRGASVSDVEARMGGSSYTVRTLERLIEEHPKTRFRLVIGTDLADEVPSWFEGHRVPELAPLLVVGRGGHTGGGEDIAMPEVSSTEIRRRIAAGQPADGLVPRAVLSYIAKHELYRS